MRHSTVEKLKTLDRAYQKKILLWLKSIGFKADAKYLGKKLDEGKNYGTN
jgi:mRNA-degrading endonuclease RelE of RelBE toxin-antitoxin system